MRFPIGNVISTTSLSHCILIALDRCLQAIDQTNFSLVHLAISTALNVELSSFRAACPSVRLVGLHCTCTTQTGRKGTSSLSAGKWQLYDIYATPGIYSDVTCNLTLPYLWHATPGIYSDVTCDLPLPYHTYDMQLQAYKRCNMLPYLTLPMTATPGETIRMLSIGRNNRSHLVKTLRAKAQDKETIAAGQYLLNHVTGWIRTHYPCKSGQTHKHTHKTHTHIHPHTQ